MRKSTEKREELLELAMEIAEEYDGNLTLRQLFYRCVAAGHIDNDPKQYKRLGDIIAQARMDGRLPFDSLTDRTRESHAGAFHYINLDPRSGLRAAGDELKRAPESYLWADRWFGQPNHVSVWIEKEALAGVLEQAVAGLGVSRFVLRGYASLSTLYEWAKQLDKATTARRELGRPIETAHILYFGDHDPDGIEIPRSALRNIEGIVSIEQLVVPPIELKRVALNQDQIRQYNPPPFKAKQTSSRFQAYVDETGLREAWELDALPPRALTQLMRDEVGALYDPQIGLEVREQVRVAREEMRALMTPDWLRAQLGGQLELEDESEDEPEE